VTFLFAALAVGGIATPEIAVPAPNPGAAPTSLTVVSWFQPVDWRTR